MISLNFFKRCTINNRDLILCAMVILFRIDLAASKMPQQSVPLSSAKSYPVYVPSSETQQLPHQMKKINGKRPGHGLPTIMKIFENPTPNDGYESLRKFSDGMKDGMFPTQLYNTSIALTSALLAFQLPSNHDTEEHTVNMANQTIFGLFAFLTAVLIFALPVLLTGQKFNNEARSSNEGIISSMFKNEALAKLIENGVHKKIGLEPEKCLQKTICEAHRSPQNKRFGMMAMPFQLFYPPSANENGDASRANSYQEAAYTGKYLSTRCGKKYNCFFDVLDMARYLVDWYQYHHGTVDSSN